MYLYKNDYIDHNITDKLDFKKLHQKMKRPLNTKDVVGLIDVIYNGRNWKAGTRMPEIQKTPAIVVERGNKCSRPR